eukprot:g31199.t1
MVHRKCVGLIISNSAGCVSDYRFTIQHRLVDYHNTFRRDRDYLQDVTQQISPRGVSVIQTTGLRFKLMLISGLP